MRVLFDISHQKHVRFFKPMIARLQATGAVVATVSRDWGEVNVVRKGLQLPARVLGRHGGGTLLGKLLSANERIELLARHLAAVRPDVAVTLTNPETARVAFGLQIPLVCFNDMPEALAVGKLSLPLASKVCAPWIVPARDFIRHGVAPEKLFFYRALDPIIWLKHHPVDRTYLERLGLDGQRPIVVCRETEWQSAYANEDIVTAAARQLRRRHRGWHVLSIPRYTPHPFYDVPSLLAQADLFIGGGGTMCIEAAYYGTPVIATRPIASRYMTWLFRQRVAVPARTVPQVVELAEAAIAQRSARRLAARRARARRIFGRMTFPLAHVVNLIQQSANGSRRDPS